MGPKRVSKSGLFILELIFSILFFSITSAVCVSLFVHARLVSIQSSDLTAASLKAQDTAEAFKAVNADIDSLTKLLDSQQTKPELLQIYYDKNWNPVSDKTDSQYTLTLTSENSQPVSGQICSAKIVVYKEQEELFSLDVSHYVH